MINSDDLKVALTRLAEDLEMSFESKRSTLKNLSDFGPGELEEQWCHSLR